jgi:hypothetical protein
LYIKLIAIQFIEDDVVTSPKEKKQEFQFMASSSFPDNSNCLENYARCHALHTCLYSLVVTPLEVTSNIKAELSR